MEIHASKAFILFTHYINDVQMYFFFLKKKRVY
jgi:hypothetical protein